MRRLQNFSLLEPNASLGRYSLHACAHDCTVGYLNKVSELELYQLAFHCVAGAYTQGHHERSWLANRRLLPHTVNLRDSRLGTVRDIPKKSGAVLDIICFGTLFQNYGMLEEADKMFILAHEYAEETYVLQHEVIVTILTGLAVVYSMMNKPDEVGQIDIRVLEAQQQAFRPIDVSTFRTFDFLGQFYADLGKLDDAETMYVRALEGYEKVIGPKHIWTTGVMHNLGKIYPDQGKLEESQTICLGALGEYEETIGPNHLQALDVVHSLGSLYRIQGKLDESEKMFLRTLQGYEGAIGLQHMRTLSAVLRPGDINALQGKLEEAESMLLRAVDGFREPFGPNYLLALQSIHTPGHMYWKRGQLDKAEESMIQVIEGYKETLGIEHKSTLIKVKTLEILRGEMRESVKQISIFLSLAISSQSLMQGV